jgi:NAD(P)-dependent dehydrogenase (short-subunit alcohol dehydrogenase family)
MSVQLKKAVVVGASSGVGEAIAVALANEGAKVAVLGRREDELARVVKRAPNSLKAYIHDVRQYDETPSLFERIVQELGGLDALVYAAGVMPKVAEGEYDFQKDRLMMETNVVGAMAWLNLAAARFEAAGKGTLMGISSIAGERGRRGAPGYGASKAALTSYLESLRNRCSRYGVNVVTIKPGFVDTAMTRGLKGLFWLVSPETVARRSLALAKRGNSASAFVPWRWGWVARIVRAIPSLLFRRLNF